LKIFLDHCVLKRLLRLLPEHEVKTAFQIGWAAKKNGELLKLIEGEFEVFITVDQNLRYQQNLASSQLTVIVLIAASNRYETSRRSSCKLKRRSLIWCPAMWSRFPELSGAVLQMPLDEKRFPPTSETSPIRAMSPASVTTRRR
jgi:hypothetical protein